MLDHEGRTPQEAYQYWQAPDTTKSDRPIPPPQAKDLKQAADITRADHEGINPELEGQIRGSTEFHAIETAYSGRRKNPATAERNDRALADSISEELSRGIQRKEYDAFTPAELERTMARIAAGHDKTLLSAEQRVAAQRVVDDIAHKIRNRVSTASTARKGETSLEKALYSYAESQDYGAMDDTPRSIPVQLDSPDARKLHITLGRLEGFAGAAIKDGTPESLEVALAAIKHRHRLYLLQHDAGATPTMANPHKETVSLEDRGSDFWTKPEVLAKAADLSRITYDLEQIRDAAAKVAGGQRVRSEAEGYLQLVDQAKQLHNY